MYTRTHTHTLASIYIDWSAGSSVIILMSVSIKLAMTGAISYFQNAADNGGNDDEILKKINQNIFKKNRHSKPL